MLTDSRFSAGEIQAHLGVPVEPDPGHPARRGAADALVAGRDAAAPREPLVLFVGSIFNRRRLPDLMAAFAGLGRTHPRRPPADHRRESHVPQAGSGPDRGGAAASPAASSIRRYVPDDELAHAYRTASVFAFLSEYEGFGLTPLEALACGIPAVVLDTPVAREVCQDARRLCRARRHRGHDRGARGSAHERRPPGVAAGRRRTRPVAVLLAGGRAGHD